MEGQREPGEQLSSDTVRVDHIVVDLEPGAVGEFDREHPAQATDLDRITDFSHAGQVPLRLYDRRKLADDLVDEAVAQLARFFMR